MKFAVLGDVLGNDRLLAAVLETLARRGIGAESVVSMGNLIGRHGDSARCMALAEEFALCLQGPLERALTMDHPFAEDLPDHAPVDEPPQYIAELREWLEDDVLLAAHNWPRELIDPPHAFLDQARGLSRVPDSVRVRFVAAAGSFWIPGLPETYLEALRQRDGPEPVTGTPVDHDDEHFVQREVIIPADGDEWELSLDGAMPATVHVGSRIGLDPPMADAKRIVSVWTVDDRYLRFQAFR